MLATEEGEEFIVERIVSHRIRNGRKEYLLQWKGFSEEENTWEPEHNLDCPDLIEEYENRLAQKNRYMANDPSLKRKPSLDQPAGPNKRGRPPLDRNHYSRQQQQQQQQQPSQQQQQQQQPTSNSNRTSSSTAATNDEPSAFDRGYEAEKILGATDAMGELMLLVQWKGTSEADLVPSRICNVKCPQVVIRFYEERLTWITSQQNNNENNPNSSSDNLLLSTTQTANNLLENKNSL